MSETADSRASDRQKPRIRAATAAHVESIRACVREAYDLYVERMDQEPAPMAADYAEVVAAGQVDVLELEGAIVGVLVSFQKEDHYFVENVAVSPSLQGTGQGRALLDFAEEKARALGLKEMGLYTHASMHENISYYPRLGYEEVGRHEEDGFERVFFVKRLVD